MVYPSYRKFFSEIDLKSALYFWKAYPSPLHLRDKTAEDLTSELKAIASNIGKTKYFKVLIGSDVYYILKSDAKGFKVTQKMYYHFTRKDLVQVGAVIHADCLQ